MSTSEPPKGGGHYSGHNPVPNIKKFVESLDKEKKQRDKKIEEEAEARRLRGGPMAGSDVKDHIEDKPKGDAASRKTVTDPVTGREVIIEDVNADFMKAVDDPQVSVVNLPILLCLTSK